MYPLEYQMEQERARLEWERGIQEKITSINANFEAIAERDKVLNENHSL